VIIGSIDPGKHGCAYAIGRQGQIIDVDYGTDNGIWKEIVIDVLYFELPQIYPGVRNEDPNDLIQVTYWGTRFLNQFDARKIIEIHPREWKGSIKKETMLRRIEEKVLTPEELHLVNLLNLPKETRHNALDACGILAHAFGRLSY